jgi:DNA-directed RNA polymerase specialized sigma24 family protein
MPSGTPCPCLLCSTEANLLKASGLSEKEIVEELFGKSAHLYRFTSVSALIRHLRSAAPETEIDVILGALCAFRKTHSDITETLLVLAFLPMLHVAIRRVTSVQPALAIEDVTQEALSFLLQYLDSADLQARRSHYAFAISRAVKRKLFEWARRQSRIENIEGYRNSNLTSFVGTDEALEKQATLRDFLHNAVARQLLTDRELDLLMEFKLEGNGGSEFEASGRGNSNVLRQRLKRLLAKLRRIANAKSINAVRPATSAREFKASGTVKNFH